MSDISKTMHVHMKSSGIKETTKDIDAMNKAGGRAAATQDKAEKGAAGFAKNSTASFAKMSQGLGGLVHVYATVAANVFALSSAFMVLKEAVDVDIMIRAADQLSTSTGISYANVAKNMKGVTQGALSMQDALRSASIGVSSGLSGKQMQDIAEIATKAANALGRSVPEAINRMTQAVVKNEPELVDEYGIILRVDSALKDYAATLGKTKSELTSFDKQMAIHAQLVKQGTTKFGDVEGQVNAYNQLGASFSELTHNVVTFVNTALEPLASLFAENKSLLTALAAVFAQSVFKKAVPEIQNMTSRLAEQRKEYEQLIATKKEDLDVLDNIHSMQGIEVDVMKLDDANFDKKAKDLFESMPYDVLENELDEKLVKGLKSGTNKGFEYFDTISKKTIKSIQGNVENLTSGSAAERRIAKENLATYGLTTEKAKELDALYRRHTGELNKQNVDSKKNLNWMQQKTLELQKQLMLIEKQRLVAKNLRSEAFSAGATGGFMGGGLDAANAGIRSARASGETVTKLTAGATRVAGIFGNISGILGSIMSLVSGWGIALFAISQLVLPIADGLGLASKASREAQDNLNETTESLAKLQDTASKIDGKNIEDLQGYLDNVTASANNLNEQMSKIVEQSETLGALKDITVLDKLFNWDSTDLKSATADFKSQIEELHLKRGIVPPEDLDNLVDKISKAAVSLSYQKDNLVKLNEELKKEKGNTEVIERLTVKKRFLMESIVSTQKELTIAQNDSLKATKEELQAKRDLADIINKSKNAIDSIAKDEAEARNKYAKSSPYFKTLEDLKSIQDNINAAEGGQAKLNAIAAEYSKLTGESAVTSKNLQSSLTARTKIAKKANAAAIKSKIKELKLDANIALLNESIRNGNKEAILDLISKTEDLNNIKIDMLKADRGALIISIAQEKNLQIKIQRWKELELINATINGLIIKNGIAERKNLDTYNEQYNVLDRKLSILNSETDIINTQLNLAKKQGDISLQYSLEREKAAKEVETIETKISKLNEESSKHQEKRLENDAKILALKEKKLSIEKLTTLEFNKQAAEAERAKGLIRTRINLSSELQRGLESQLKIQQSKIEEPRQSGPGAKNLEAFKKAEALKEKIILEKQSQLRGKMVLETKALTKVLKENRSITDKTVKAEKDALDRSETRVKIMSIANDIGDLGLENTLNKRDAELEILDIQRQIHEYNKKNASAENIFKDPKGFTELLGKEFEYIAEDFSKSIMNPVERASDSMLRVMDTATDTLYDAIKSGENVGKAVGDAILATADDITREITTDIMKQWSRDILKNAFGIESAAEKRAREQKEEQERQTELQKKIEVNTRCKQGVGGGSMELADSSFSVLNKGSDIGDMFKGFEASKGFETAELTDNFSSFEEALNASSDINLDGFAQTGTIFQTSMSEMTSTLVDSNSSLFGSLGGMFSSSGGSSGGGIGSAIGGMFGGVGGAIGGIVDMFFANGGITNSLNRYADGAVTNGPEIAMIGDNSSGKEAVVPLPSGDKIPVEFSGDSTGGDTIINNNINISGVDTNNRDAVRRSAGQVAQAAGNATNRAVRRNG